MSSQDKISESRENQIKRYADFLRSMNTSLEDYLYVLDVERMKLWIFGDATKKYDFGEPAEDGSYSGDAWVRLAHPADRGALMDDVAQLASGTKKTHDLDYRILGKDGEHVWVNCQGTMMTDDDGTLPIAVEQVSEILD